MSPQGAQPRADERDVAVGSEHKLSTPEGEKVFPLERLDVKTKPIAEGSQIVVELNEAGTVIDLWKAQ